MWQIEADRYNKRMVRKVEQNRKLLSPDRSTINIAWPRKPNNQETKSSCTMNGNLGTANRFPFCSRTPGNREERNISVADGLMNIEKLRDLSIMSHDLGDVFQLRHVTYVASSGSNLMPISALKHAGESLNIGEKGSSMNKSIPEIKRKDNMYLSVVRRSNSETLENQ